MKRQTALIGLSLLLGLGLSACGDKPQTLGGARQDAPPYVGTGSPYVAPGWKQGDKTSWEQQLRVRTQGGQGEGVAKAAN